MAPFSAMPRPSVAEVQLHIPLFAERSLLTEWLTDALSTELDRESSVIDDVQEGGSGTCIYLHGIDADDMIRVARKLLGECGRLSAVRIIETRPRLEEGFAA